MTWRLLKTRVYWHLGVYFTGKNSISSQSTKKKVIFLSLLIPSYFGPTLYTKGGHPDLPLPYFLINTWSYKPQILQGIRDTLQGLRKHKVCKKSFAWLPWQLFDNMVLFANNCQNDYEKQVFFKCSQKLQITRC